MIFVSFFFFFFNSEIALFLFFFFILLLLCVMRRVLTISVYKTLESTFLLFFYQRFIAHLCYTRRCCITIKQVLLTHICVFFLSIASVAAQGPCYTSAFSFSSFFVVCVSVLNAFFFFFSLFECSQYPLCPATRHFTQVQLRLLWNLKKPPLPVFFSLVVCLFVFPESSTVPYF